MVGGEFTLVNGKPQQGLTRFGPDNNSAPSRRPVIQPTSEGAMQVRWRRRGRPGRQRADLLGLPQRRVHADLDRAGQLGVVEATPGDASSTPTVRPGSATPTRGPGQRRHQPSALSGPPVDAAIATAASYAAAVRADRPSLYWNAPPTGVVGPGRGCQHQRHAHVCRAGRSKGTGGSTDSAVADGLPGSLSFDGTDDYVWNDEFAVAPSTYSVEAWVKTTTTRGGKIIGYGNGRP